MRSTRPSATWRDNLYDELVIDNFAGGGGASLGIEQALGRPCDLAINHDPAAIAMHMVNHPGTEHYCGDVFDVDPVKATRGRPVGLAWFSPDCTHHSKARGSAPVSPRRRALAWVVIRWAKKARPRVIMLENVEEFEDWGPLIHAKGPGGKPLYDKAGRPVMVPDKKRKGETFKKWLNELRACGYQVEWRQLRASDYGAPTIRKRLFLIARCDGRPIVWPDASHGSPSQIARNPELRLWHTAAECIDWSLPCPSIFERKKPLAENTLKRIALGIQRYVIDTPEPFIIRYNSEKSQADCHSRGTDAPLGTVTTANRFGLVVPHIAGAGGPRYGGKPRAANEPMGTLTTENHRAVVAATLCGCGGRAGQSPPRPVNSPTGTTTSKADSCLVAANLARIGQTGGKGKYANAADEPLTTIVSKNEHIVCSTWMVRHFGGMVGRDLRQPVPTTTTKGCQNQLAAASLVKFRGTCRDGQPVTEPMPTVTAGGLHVAEVRAFLVKYYGQGVGQSCREPAHTLTTKQRLGLVMVAGEEYQIADIGMRMLKPHELYRAQGFPSDYIINPLHPTKGKPLTQEEQVRMCGNSVVPAMARALVEANLVKQTAAIAVG